MYIYSKTLALESYQSLWKNKDIGCKPSSREDGLYCSQFQVLIPDPHIRRSRVLTIGNCSPPVGLYWWLFQLASCEEYLDHVGFVRSAFGTGCALGALGCAGTVTSCERCVISLTFDFYLHSNPQTRNDIPLYPR